MDPTNKQKEYMMKEKFKQIFEGSKDSLWSISKRGTRRKW
jgi:hypothetical protein